MPQTRSAAKKAAQIGDKHSTNEHQHDSAVPDAKRLKHDKDAKPKVETAVKREEDGGDLTRVTQREPKKRASSKDTTAVKILERGLIYFFTRGRVEVHDPQSMADIARSYLILRPVPAKEEFVTSSAKKVRIFVLPRKTLPKKRGERMMAFVDKAGASVNELKEDFLQGSEYETKTVGKRHIPPATPMGEGVYAITGTSGDSHLCYLLTLPPEPGPLQYEFGLASRGSFIISTKNPHFPGPASARLPQAPDYPKRVLESFESYRWIPSVPEHLDYQNTQVLLIREREGLGRAGSVERGKDSGDRVKHEAANFEEAMEELEEADLERMEHLGPDASEAIYADLKADSEKYPSLRTEF